jgi:hypothetical protein
MVTTAIAWLAGIALVAVAASPARFERVFDAAAKAPIETREDVDAAARTTRAFMRTWRLLALAVGGVCILLGVLGILR